MNTDLIFATYNGASRLAQMLDELCRLEMPAKCKLRIIAVDNGSTDRSAALIERYADRLPIQRLEQPEPGKNAALNLALQHSRGELVVLTDDDIVPRRDWLQQLLAAVAAHPECDLFGGRVCPRWPRPPPSRLLEEIPLGPAYAITPDQLTGGPCEASRIWGPNMAVRQSVFRAGHRFDEDVGPRGGDYVMGGETEFLTRCERHGHRACFVSDAVVEHMIRPEQFTPRWLRARGHRFGRSHFRHERATGALVPTPHIGGVPRWVLRRQLAARLRAAMPFRENYRAAWQAGFYAGYLHEYRSWQEYEKERG